MIYVMTFGTLTLEYFSPVCVGWKTSAAAPSYLASFADDIALPARE
jgi:hypothetical protein